MVEFTIGEVTYQTRKMNAFSQFHVLRALSPIIAQIGPKFITEPSSVDDLVSKLVPALETLADMDEAKVNNILFRCMAVVSMQQGTMWVPIFNEQAQRMMFDTIDLPTMLQIMMQVISENLASFSIGIGPASKEAMSQPNGPLQTSSFFQMEKIS